MTLKQFLGFGYPTQVFEIISKELETIATGTPIEIKDSLDTDKYLIEEFSANLDIIQVWTSFGERGIA